MPPPNLYACVHILVATIARKTAGAARTRSSLRPLSSVRANEMQNSGQNMPREREHMSHNVRSVATKQSSYPVCREMDCFASLAMTRREPRTSPRQIPLDCRQKENRDIDRKPDAPQDRPQHRAVAEIGEDISDPHDQKQHRQFVDQAQRPETKLRQQHGHRKERKRLDAVLMGAERAGADRVLIENRIAGPRIVEPAMPGPFDRGDRQQIQHQRSENAEFGDRHGSSRPRQYGEAYRTEANLDKDGATREATEIMTVAV